MNRVLLKDLIEIKNGTDYRNLEEGDIPVYGTGGYMTSVNKYLYDGVSILLPRKGSLKNISFVEGKFWTVDTMYWSIVNKHLINPYFLFYYLKTLNFEALYTGSTLPSMTNSAYYSIPILVPSIDSQDKIANLLYAIDNKIKINREINLELESMAKTLYEYWFVQFDFPDKNGKPYKSAGGDLVYNEALKREIPKGWKVDNIQKYCNIIDCLHSKKPDYNYESAEFYLLQLENLQENGYIDVTDKHYISGVDYINWTKKIEIKENDFVFTNAGRAGAFGKIPGEIKCALGRNFTAVRPINISPYYLRLYFSSTDMEKQIISNLDCGAFFKSFNVKSIKLINLLIPENEILNKFINIVKPIIKKIENNNAEDSKLAALRDFLLPMLMNGQITIKKDLGQTSNNEALSSDKLIEEAIYQYNNNRCIDIESIARSNDMVVYKDDSVKKAEISFNKEKGLWQIAVREPQDSFSIAHEIAHAVLHPEFVKQAAVARKDEHSLPKEKEIEADSLAAEILMPEECILEYLKDENIADNSFLDKKFVEKSAKKFNVAPSSMNMRLKTLGYKVPYIS
ncbi:MAG: restriction endonuclease subunit S [Candidatus Gastranaerophilales bacterium]|nr:restriction endonuclease subunit S [Candidatus Gastranaerophilales bacterium]